MPILLPCSCGKKLRVKDELIGRKFRCPSCGAVLPVAPVAKEEKEEAAAAPLTWEEIGLSEPEPGRNEAMASNPGKVRLHYWHYFRCYPTWPMIFGCLPLLFLAPALLWHWAFWTGFVLFLVPNWLLWSRMKWRGLYGNADPAVVVATDPYLVAVLTDMGTTSEGYPMVKILAQPLKRMTGGPPRKNTRLAAVALYGGVASDHWIDFFPAVVNCLTTNKRVIAGVMASIPEKEWQALTEALNHVPKPYRPGLYWIQSVQEEDGNREREPLPRKKLKKVIGEYLPHDDFSDWYLAEEEIPEKKLQEALDIYGKGVNPEQVLALGARNAREGILLTVDYFIVCNGGWSGQVRWIDMEDGEILEGKEIDLTCAGGKHLRIDMFGFSKGIISGLAKLFRHIGEWNEERGDQDPPSSGS